MPRHDNRPADQLRPLTVQRPFTCAPHGSVLLTAGQTMVLCTASIEEKVPAWLEGKGKGWVTAEYDMLPGSTRPRKPRDRSGRVDGRTTEIQRLIGRSLRAVMDLEALGPRTITLDCDVLQADGGTRTLSITGAFIALVDALNASDLHSAGSASRAGQSAPTGETTAASNASQATSGGALNASGLVGGPNEQSGGGRQLLTDSVAAISVGIVAGQALLDLDYQEDVAASVDMNVVMTGSGRLVELQGTGEEATFDEQQLMTMLKLARRGIADLTRLQQQHLGAHMWGRHSCLPA